MLREELNDLLGEEIAFVVRRAIAPILIFIAILIARRLIPIILKRSFRGIEKFAILTKLPQKFLQEEVLMAFVPPLRLFVSVVGFWLISLFFDLDPAYQKTLDDLATTLLLFSIFWAIFRSVDAGFTIWNERNRALEQPENRFNETILQFLMRIVEAGVVIFAVVVIFEQWAIDLTGLLAGLGLGGLAVALAAQDALANLIGYFSIIADNPFDVGDYIITSDFEGVVETIGFRTTRLRRSDRAIIHVPNRILANDVVTNWSQTVDGPRRGRARITITLGLTYSTTADQMQGIVGDIQVMLTEHERIMPSSVVVHFVEFGASSLDILIAFTTRINSWRDIQATKESVNLNIMRLVAEHDLDIAFPTRTIVLEQGPAAPAVE